MVPSAPSCRKPLHGPGHSARRREMCAYVRCVPIACATVRRGRPMSGNAPPWKRLSLASHPGTLPDAFMLPFDPADGDISLFAASGIACAPAMARSVTKRRAEYLAGRRVALAALADAGAHV